jgi:hypothetical protein
MKLSRNKIAKLLKIGNQSRKNIKYKKRSKSLNINKLHGLNASDLVILPKPGQRAKTAHIKPKPLNLRFKTLKNRQNKMIGGSNKFSLLYYKSDINNYTDLLDNKVTITLKIDDADVIIKKIKEVMNELKKATPTVNQTDQSTSLPIYDIASPSPENPEYPELQSIGAKADPLSLDTYGGITYKNTLLTPTTTLAQLKSKYPTMKEEPFKLRSKIYVFFHRILYGDLFYLIDIASIRHIMSFLNYSNEYADLITFGKDDSADVEDINVEGEGEGEGEQAGGKADRDYSNIPEIVLKILKGENIVDQTTDKDVTISNAKADEKIKGSTFDQKYKLVIEKKKIKYISIAISNFIKNNMMVDSVQPINDVEAVQTKLDLLVISTYLLSVFPSSGNNTRRLENINALQKLNKVYQYIQPEDYILTKNPQIFKFTFNMFKSAPKITQNDINNLNEAKKALRILTNEYVSYNGPIENGTGPDPKFLFYTLGKTLRPNRTLIKNTITEDIRTLEYKLRKNVSTQDELLELLKSYNINKENTSIRKMYEKLTKDSSSWKNFLKASRVLDTIKEVVGYTTQKIVPIGNKLIKTKESSKQSQESQKQLATQKSKEDAINNFKEAIKTITESVENISSYIEANKPAQAGGVTEGAAEGAAKREEDVVKRAEVEEREGEEEAATESSTESNLEYATEINGLIDSINKNMQILKDPIDKTEPPEIQKIKAMPQFKIFVKNIENDVNQLKPIIPQTSAVASVGGSDQYGGAEQSGGATYEDLKIINDKLKKHAKELDDFIKKQLPSATNVAAVTKVVAAVTKAALAPTAAMQAVGAVPANILDKIDELINQKISEKKEKKESESDDIKASIKAAIMDGPDGSDRKIKFIVEIPKWQQLKMMGPMDSSTEDAALGLTMDLANLDHTKLMEEVKAKNDEFEKLFTDAKEKLKTQGDQVTQEITKVIEAKKKELNDLKTKLEQETAEATASAATIQPQDTDLATLKGQIMELKEQVDALKTAAEAATQLNQTTVEANKANKATENSSNGGAKYNRTNNSTIKHYNIKHNKTKRRDNRRLNIKGGATADATTATADPTAATTAATTAVDTAVKNVDPSATTNVETATTADDTTAVPSAAVENVESATAAENANTAATTTNVESATVENVDPAVPSENVDPAATTAVDTADPADTATTTNPHTEQQVIARANALIEKAEKLLQENKPNPDEGSAPQSGEKKPEGEEENTSNPPEKQTETSAAETIATETSAADKTPEETIATETSAAEPVETTPPPEETPAPEENTAAEKKSQETTAAPEQQPNIKNPNQPKIGGSKAKKHKTTRSIKKSNIKKSNKKKSNKKKSNKKKSNKK